MKSIAEIGVYNGENAVYLRRLFPDAHLYLIDPWDFYEEYADKGGPIALDQQSYENAYNKVCRIFEKDPNATILRMSSVESASKVTSQLDLVFIDGNHDYRYVKEDIEVWSNKVRKGGIISGHDYNNTFEGVKQAVNEAFPDRLIVGVDSLWASISQ